MLDSETKNRINTARDILVGKVPDPKSQVEQITIALIYKFMDDMDVESEDLGGKRTFFVDEYAKYAWRKIFDPRQSGYDLLNLYSEAIAKMDTNPGVPKLFRDIFKNAYLPYRDPETLKSFLKIINEFEYSHSEKLGDAFEFLLSILGSQGDAGQFRTPRHIIDFMVAIMDPKKHEVILDPACGTAGFLISSYKHIIKKNSSNYFPDKDQGIALDGTQSVNEVILTTNGFSGDKLTADDRKLLADNIHGYDISPDMVRLSLVNMYLHGVKEPQIFEYDSLTSEDHWNEYSDVILANPPFMSPKGGIRPHKRFSVQSNRSEVLFVDYIAEHLTTNGRACVIVPEGIIFQSGNAYKQLRKMLVEQYLVGVISLPAGVFNPYSGVKTSILWLDKAMAKKTDKILFVKIENDGFDLGAQRRAIKQNDLPIMTDRIKQIKRSLQNESVIAKFDDEKSILVERSKILDNSDINLSVARYSTTNLSGLKSEMISLSDLCDLQNGFAFKSQDYVDKSNTLNFRMSNIRPNGDVDLDHNTIYLPDEYTEKYSDYLLNEGDLVIAMTDMANDPKILGVPTIIKQDSRNLLLNQRVGKFININRDKISLPFLKYTLNSLPVKNYYKSLGGGGLQINIGKKDILSLRIPLPSLSIQEEIVTEIHSYQKIIDGARMVVEYYKPRIEIDPEWKTVELGEVIEKFQYGSSKKSLEEGEIPCLRMGNIQDGEIVWDDIKYAPSDEDIEKLLLKQDDILFNRTNSPLHVGKTGIFKSDKKAVFAGYLIRLKYDKTIIHGEYLNYCLNTPSAREFYQHVKTDGIHQSNINPKNLSTFKFPLPPIDVQRHIMSEVAREKTLINVSRQIITVFEQKIKDRVAKVWGD